MRHLTLFALGFAASAANAQGLDRDTLLTDAPAVAPKGTVRVTGGAMGTTDSAGVGATQGQANISGSIQGSPLQNFSGDVGAYFQVGAQGPTGRVRIQVEAGDSENAAAKPPGVRDYDLTSGPAVSWMVTRTFQVQALVGVAQPKKTAITAPVGVVSASVDF